MADPRRSTPEEERRRGAKIRAAALVVLLVVLFVLAGPRPTIGPVSLDVAVPDSLPLLGARIDAEEAAFDDIVPGAEARIVWADPDDPAVTELALVYLHGFSATHRETAPLTETVAAALHANAYLTRLTGHGRTGEALGDATTEDWLRDAAEAVAVGRALGRRVVLLGVSTGGTLAAWAAAQEELADDIAALVLVSPNFRIGDPTARILTWPWGGLIARAIVGPERSFEPHNPEQARYWTERYPTRVLPEMAALVKLMDDDLLADVRAPTLVFVSPDDQVIDPDAVVAAMDRLGAEHSELVRVTDAVDPSNHVLAGDILSPGRTKEVVERVVAFLRELPD